MRFAWQIRVTQIQTRAEIHLKVNNKNIFCGIHIGNVFVNLLDVTLNRWILLCVGMWRTCCKVLWLLTNIYSLIYRFKSHKLEVIIHENALHVFKHQRNQILKERLKDEQQDEVVGGGQSWNAWFTAYFTCKPWAWPLWQPIDFSHRCRPSVQRVATPVVNFDL